jgi:hypothetical protein
LEETRRIIRTGNVMVDNEGKGGLRRERRKTVRSKAILPALVLMGEQEKKTKTANVSLGGLMIHTEEPLRRNETLRIAFIAKADAIEAEGRVVYSIKSGSGYLSGLCFEKIPPGDREKLSRYLGTLAPSPRQDPVPVTWKARDARPVALDTTTEVILPESLVSAMLIMRGDRKSEKTVYEINRTVTSIGRHEDNQIVLKDPSVSGHHAKIRLEEDGFFIYDFASTNGTRVNGQKTYRKRIKDGDVIEIGQPAFTFVTKKRRF